MSAYNRAVQHSALVVVQAFGTQAEADLAKSMLESAGIDVMIQADRAGGMRDHLAWSGFGFKVLVREEDAIAARDVLNSSHDSELVLVRTFATQAEADIALNALLSAGIVAIVEDNSAAGLRMAVPGSRTGFRLLAPKDDVDKAREALQQFL